MSGDIKTDRQLAIFFRAIKGEAISAQKLAQEYKVSSRSVSRDITGIKMFLADHRDLVGNAELVYSSADHCYRLSMDNFITNKELFAITKILIGTQALSGDDLLKLIGKLKAHSSLGGRKALENLLHKELYHYTGIKHDCQSLLDNIWSLSECIESKQPLTVTYYRMDRQQVKHKLKPVSIMFAEYYFYLLAYDYEAEGGYPLYFRIDRITGIVKHRERFQLTEEQNFDEGLLRKRSQFMWPGKLRHISFEFRGPSVQAILDRLPTARIIDSCGDMYTLEAEVYGDGIKMFLLSQGNWVKVLGPQEFVEEIRDEVLKMYAQYQTE